MAQYTFSRTEKKYAVPLSLYPKVKAFVETFMVPEPKYHIYTLCNVYYDTDHFELARRSVEKPVFKEKLRIRSYGTPTEDTKVYIEAKIKYKGVVYKRRVGMPLSAVDEFLLHGKPPKDTQIARELLYFNKLFDLKPKVYLAYDRIAYVGKDNPDLRLTFDENIRYRTDNLSLEAGDSGIPLLPDGTRIMEIKAPGAVPPEVLEMLKRFSITPVSFSKYGTIYKKILTEAKEPVHV